MAETEKLSLATKLALIGKELGATAKAGKNAEQGYKFIEYAAVSGKMRDLLANHHIVVVPAVVDYEKDTVSTARGTTGFHYVVQMRFTAINGDDPDDRIEATWLGESTDYGDKGINKAETSGTKYFYMRLLNISEKSDEDADKTTPEEAVSANTSRSKSRLDFDTVRMQVNAIDDLKSLTEFYRGLPLGTLNEKQKAVIDRIFGDRRKELER